MELRVDGGGMHRTVSSSAGHAMARAIVEALHTPIAAAVQAVVISTVKTGYDIYGEMQDDSRVQARPRGAVAALVGGAEDLRTAIEVTAQRARVSMRIREIQGEAEIRQLFLDLGRR
ncbi:hypothetical protein [Symbioplanes lichenis]|uniref:hypothetical protein n=1 Tax=Symbioplanes lichenis TaxID=1629072 RepID=UPI002738B96D|nr:hypothetical protein [Actinoplanes lichenis]